MRPMGDVRIGAKVQNGQVVRIPKSTLEIMAIVELPATVDAMAETAVTATYSR